MPAPATENYQQVSQLFQQYGIEAVNAAQAAAGGVAVDLARNAEVPVAVGFDLR